MAEPNPPPAPLSPGEQKFHMIDVGGKPPTQRRAVAVGRIQMSAAAFNALQRGANPKGDVLAQAEVAGMMAAKRTADLLPLCHPLPLDQVAVRFELAPASCEVVARCEAVATAKTGVEMEVLSGVCGALLAVYDLCKAVDPVLTITNVHLEVKEGGKSGRWVHPLHGTGR